MFSSLLAPQVTLEHSPLHLSLDLSALTQPLSSLYPNLSLFVSLHPHLLHTLFHISPFFYFFIAFPLFFCLLLACGCFLSTSWHFRSIISGYAMCLESKKVCHFLQLGVPWSDSCIILFSPLPVHFLTNHPPATHFMHYPSFLPVPFLQFPFWCEGAFVKCVKGVKREPGRIRIQSENTTRKTPEALEPSVSANAIGQTVTVQTLDIMDGKH